jgi:hypothetical protein
MRLARGTTTYFCPAAADRHSIEARATEEFRVKLTTMKNSLTTMKNSASSIVSGLMLSAGQHRTILKTAGCFRSY